MCSRCSATTPQRMLAVAAQDAICLAVTRSNLFAAAGDDEEAARMVIDNVVRRLRTRVATGSLAATG